MYQKQNIYGAKKDFGTGPSNYIAGMGRGAQGFITRSDIGPAKTTEPALQQAQQQQQQLQQQQQQRPRGNHQDDDDGDREDYNDAKYDEWNGYQIPLFNQGEYDDEDREADQVYSVIDEHLEGRRRTRREKIQLAEIKRIRQERPTLALQFSDLKRDLAKITVQEWLNIPESGDYSIKKRRQDKYVPAPDSLLDGARRQGEKGNMIDEGAESVGVQKLNEIGEARGALLSLKLDRMGDNVSGQTNVDKKGYLTDLASIPISSGVEIGDYKKARLLLKSLIQSDPQSSFGWISAARVEELDGKLQAARNILAQGLQTCSNNEELWIECARLETFERAKQILAKAASLHPTSVKIWLAAANKETDRAIKCKVLKRSLEFIPNSEMLWKELIELSSESEAKILLHKAVECIPQQLEFWLALAKLETYEQAKIVLNKARQYLPTEPSIWIHAAKLEESAGKDNNIITAVLQKGIKVLSKNGVKIVREDWLSEAEQAEKSDNYQTCCSLVNACVEYGIHQEEREKIWQEDIITLEKKNSLFTARALFNYAIKVLEDKQKLMDQWIQFEQKHSSIHIPPPQLLFTKEQKLQNYKKYWYLDEVLSLAIQEIPSQDKYWAHSIIRRYNIGHFECMNELFLQSQQQLPNNENLLCLAGKIQTKLGNYEQASSLFTRAIDLCGGPKCYSCSIKLYLVSKDYQKADQTAEFACNQFPKNEKVWILWARVKEQLEQPNLVRKVFEKAVQQNPNNLKIWKSYIQYEISQGSYSRVRPLIEKARSKLPKNPELWVLSIHLEIEAANKKGAVFILNKALQECPRHGELWSLSIELEPHNTRKKKTADAVRICVDDPYIYLSTAKTFYMENKMEKYRRWVEKALLLNPRLGDAWAYIYIQQRQSGEDCEQLIQKCIENRPKYGRLWQQYRRCERNWQLSDKEILIEVANKIQQELLRQD